MFSLLGGMAFLAGSFLLLKLASFYWEKSRLPPGPLPLPFLGNFWQLNFQLHPATLIQLAQTHGSVLTVWVGPTPVVVLSGFRAVKEALISNSEQFSGRPLTPFFQDLFGSKGKTSLPMGRLICSNGHTWQQQRRFCLTTLGKLGLEKHVQHEAAALAAAFHQEEAEQACPVPARSHASPRPCRGRPFRPQVSIIRSTARVTGALVFGDHFLSEDTIFQELTQAVNFGLVFVSTVWRRVYDLFPWALHHLSGPHQKIFQYHKTMQSLIRREIIRHKLRDHRVPKGFINCYLSQITETMDSPISTFNEENLIQVVTDLFPGGTDTTATTLHWALIYLVHHRTIQERVQQELDEVLGTAQVICYQDRERLPYTRAILHEVQHLSSVVAMGAVRQCVTSTYVQGHYVPKGTVILPNLASVLYDPDCWDTPQQFNPGHFLDKDGNFAVNEAFLPFSAEHRVCPGDQLAQMELFLMFATLLRTFRFQLPEGSPGLRLEYVFGDTLQPQPQEICALPCLSSHSPDLRQEGL